MRIVMIFFNSLWTWLWKEKLAAREDRFMALFILFAVNMIIAIIIKAFTGSGTWALVTLTFGVVAVAIPIFWWLTKVTIDLVREFWDYFKDRRDEPFNILKK